LAPKEIGDVLARGTREYGFGRVVLGDPRLHLEQADAVSDQHRLIDVVGHEDDRLAQGALDVDELMLETFTCDAVDGSERLVHEEDRRGRAPRACENDPLALAAGQLVGVAVAVRAPGPSPEREKSVDAI